MTIVTKTGDKGTTGLFGGQRVSKDDPRIHAYGDVDELNAVLGLVIAHKEVSDPMRAQLTRVQNLLFRMGADLATPIENNAVKVPRMEQNHIDEIETWIKALEEELPPLQSFILPGGTESAAMLHLARTMTRRAERWVVSLAAKESIGPFVVIYLNRLSDYLFLLAEKANKDSGTPNTPVSYA